MKKRKDVWLKVWTAVMMGVLLFVCQSGSAYSGDAGLVLKKYPDLKIGFTTQNFSKPLPLSLGSIRKLIDVAQEHGLAWIELRDPNAGLTLEECKQLAAYGRSKNVEVGYALGAGIQDAKFSEIFARGLANAAVFDGPRTIRTALAGEDFLKDEKKKAWTLRELSRVVERANEAANQAKASGLTYVVENGREIIKGDGITSFGTTEFFANANANVGLQADVANFFVTSRTLTKPEDAKAFMERYIKKLRYIHLKTSSKEHKTLPVLAESELDFDIVFALMAKQKVPYVAIELDQPERLEDCLRNLKKSIEFLTTTY